jgi:hypothetical protein
MIVHVGGRFAYRVRPTLNQPLKRPALHGQKGLIRRSTVWKIARLVSFMAEEVRR